MRSGRGLSSSGRGDMGWWRRRYVPSSGRSVPQGLKLFPLIGLYGTAEAVPFRSCIPSNDSPSQRVQLATATCCCVITGAEGCTCFLGPRLRATRIRTRSRISAGVLAPLGRNASAEAARSKLVTVPETRSAGRKGWSCLARRTSSLPSICGMIRSDIRRSTDPGIASRRKLRASVPLVIATTR